MKYVELKRKDFALLAMVVSLERTQELPRSWGCLPRGPRAFVESGGTTMLQAMSIADDAAGIVLIRNCLLVGATNWNVADNGNVYADNTYAAATSGNAVAVTRT